LTKADLAWHALNTYGWDCDEVVDRGEQRGDYFVISCSSGLQLRVYPRPNQQPRITNIEGGYRWILPQSQNTRSLQILSKRSQEKRIWPRLEAASCYWGGNAIRANYHYSDAGKNRQT
jgi:hypothetical protein